MLWSRCIPALVLLLSVAGCASVSALDPAELPELGMIAVDVPSTRTGQLFRQEFARLASRHPSGRSRFDLEVDFSTTGDDTSETMTLTYSLYDRSPGETVLDGRISLTASFGAVSSLFGSESAASHARERLAGKLAERLYFRLLSHFSRNASG